MLNEEFIVNFPIEAFTQWVKERAMANDIITERTDIFIKNVSLNNLEGYLIVDGDFQTKFLDS